MRRMVVIIVMVLAVVGALIWYSRPAPPNPIDPDDLAALRLQATDLQRAVEALARAPDPDPAELAALAERLEALTKRLDALQSAP